MIRAVKIGFVSQPFDRVSLHALNSVGRITHNLASRLAAGGDEVVVYGNGDIEAPQRDWSAGGPSGVEYRLVTGMPIDRIVARGWHRAAPIAGAVRGGLRPPLSTSMLPMRQYARRVASAVRVSGHDVVHVQHATQLLAALRRAAPSSLLVVHVHAEWFPQTPRRTLASRLSHADVVVAVSEYVRRRIVEYVPEIEPKAVTVYNGVTVDAVAPPVEPGAPPSVLYVGALSPHKGLHDLVAGFARIADDHPTAVLRIVGPAGSYGLEECFPLDESGAGAVAGVRHWYRGDYATALSDLVPARIRDRVVFEGRLSEEEAAAAFASAAVVAFTPVWDEGFGLPAAEAMAAGRAVVGTRSGAVTETVVDGTTGFLVDKGDVGAIADRLHRLLADPELRSRMGAAGRQRAEGLFGWDVITRQMRGLYTQARTRELVR